LSVPVQLIAWKGSSVKWPVVCRVGCKTLLTQLNSHPQQNTMQVQCLIGILINSLLRNYSQVWRIPEKQLSANWVIHTAITTTRNSTSYFLPISQQLSSYSYSAVSYVPKYPFCALMLLAGW